MARISGKNGTLYVGIGSTDAASPIPFISQFTLPRTVALQDVTAMLDTNMTYVSTLPDSKGSYSGWYDTATAQLYTAAGDGVARKFYFYPDSSTTTSYFFGTGFFDTTVTFPVGAGVSISGNWGAASSIIKVG